MQFSAIVNRFIVKTKLNSAFTNDLKRKDFFQKIFIVADLVSLIMMPLQSEQTVREYQNTTVCQTKWY